ncbi:MULTISPECIES: ubiquinol-cytochrome c reductase iron-sulfur subunit [Legionella]|uniref:ubiquinol-cytochrome c reductase iron-sulfur subunit n=1 Tax=Legionella TaxID=445 RepID=UPI001F1C245F|nr:ubiquinol-cytochrome c reductase iron-sulfur subunit [Legionella septentrionalis]MCP0914569.1 ubiquinol-cytochrome c reductase iron-sulfur subunit [Legionella sp. 27cVA30]
MNHEIEPGSNSEVHDDLVDEQRRRFLLTATGVLGGVGAVCALTPFISSWMPSAKAQAAGAPVEVDLSKLEPGQQATVEWRGKPVWIIRRTQEMLKHLNDIESRLRDPESLVEQQPEYARNQYRSIKPEYLVLIGICTHLGCSPKYKPYEKELGPDWPGGFFCPCHGSSFDLAGRVFKSVPAPINLAVPPYRFINDHTIIIGEDEK